MLQVNQISFAYDELPVLEDINLNATKGEHISIIGESGCGKSTLLKLIYGLLDLEHGEIIWDQTPVLGPLFNLVPGEPYMKYLSQDFDLMLFTTVEENISEYLSVFEPIKMAKKTAELLEMIEMTAFAKTKVKYLSGGQKQRVALAKVLAQEPLLLLLDEPFSHIDNFLKNGLRRNLFAYLKKQEITVLTATHDPNDMLPFADRIVVLKDRKIIANGHPNDLHLNPKDLYIASLFGEATTIPVDYLQPYNSSKQIIVYAHEFKVSENSGLQVKVTNAYFKGSYYLIEGSYEGKKLYFNNPTAIPLNQQVFLTISTEIINKRLES